MSIAPFSDVHHALRPRRPPPRSASAPFAVLTALLCAAAYYGGAQMGFFLTFRPVPTSIFWLPNSTMFAVFLLAPPRRWWIYILAVVPAHLAVQIQNGVPPTTMPLLFLTNLGDGALGAAVVRRFSDGEPRFVRLRDMVVFMIAAVVSPLLVSFLDAGVMVATGWSSDYGLIWKTRFRSNTLTNIVWVPTVVVAASRGPNWLRSSPPRRLAEAAALALTLYAVERLVFGQPHFEAAGAALLYAPLPMFLWAAVRFGTGGVGMTILGFAFLVIWNATRGLGPFSALSPETNTFALQVFLTLLSIPAFLLAALIQEQRRIKHALRDREAQYRSIFESTSDGVLITDLDHAVVAANPAFCQLTGYSLEKLRDGHPPRTFLHLDELQPFEAYLARAGAGDGALTRAMCVREDSGLSRFELEGRRFDFGGRPHVLSVVREITEREKAYQLLEQRVAERTRALSTLLEIANTVASTLELEPLLHVVLEQLQIVVKYTGATILVEEDGDLVVLYHRGPLPLDKVSRVRIPGGGTVGRLEPSRGSPFIVDDLWGSGASAEAFRAATPPEVLALYSDARSLLVVPMKARDRTLGFLWIDSSERDQYSLQDAQLAWALADQAAVAIENARLYHQARELAAVEERQRLARELHDSVTQTLCGAAMLGHSLPDMWERDAAQGRRALTSLQEMTQGALAEMRALLLELRPDALLQTSLGDALRQLARAQPSRIAAPIHVSVERADADGADRVEAEGELPPDVHIALYRITQEALSNISKHARAAAVHLTLRWSRDSATLRIRDDGRGFQPASPGAGHLGLGIMRERAAAIGATLVIDSAPGQGTTVTVDWSDAPR